MRGSGESRVGEGGWRMADGGIVIVLCVCLTL